MFALFSLSPLEIMILGMFCFVPAVAGTIALLVIRLNRNNSQSRHTQFTRTLGQPPESYDDELTNLRTLVKLQEEKIASLENQVKELTDKLQSRGSTDIST